MRGDPSSLPKEFRSRVEAALGPDESMLYAGRPDWRAEWASLLVLLLFGAFWCSITLPLLVMSVGAAIGLVPFHYNGAPASPWVAAFFSLLMLPLGGIGLVFLAAPFLGIGKSRRTVHVVTNWRILNIDCGSPGSVEFWPFSKINYVKRKDRGNGFGCLEIGYGVAYDADGDARALFTSWSGIPDVKRAEAAMKQR
jgi:hypothetical protein